MVKNIKMQRPSENGSTAMLGLIWLFKPAKAYIYGQEGRKNNILKAGSYFCI
ncbi:Hypothetical protein FKW44_006350 [Caligus rogercresseyi]|uniref:Uncharacterized protein n=1 Tax=Caligus rogercresseyi TaxID=217165 RepID=A0A7T8KD92_CALRO|nr:Hypothetical protein FKW44_006350 [Caligus rogercresseyi]